MEFYAARRGPLIATLVAILFAVLVVIAKVLAREGFLRHSLIGLFAIPCLVAAVGLIYLKPWARILTLGLLLSLAGWISLDLYRLEGAHTFPLWYRPVLVIGNDVVALEVVGSIVLVLCVLLSWARYAFYPPENFVPNGDAL